MGATGHTHIKPLKEDKAVEIGAEILGEAFIYSMAASFLLLEYWRSSYREAQLEAEQDRDIDILQEKLKTMEQMVDTINGRISELQHFITLKDKSKKGKDSV